MSAHLKRSPGKKKPSSLGAFFSPLPGPQTASLFSRTQALPAGPGETFAMLIFPALVRLGFQRCGINILVKTKKKRPTAMAVGGPHGKKRASRPINAHPVILVVPRICLGNSGKRERREGSACVGGFGPCPTGPGGKTNSRRLIYPHNNK